LKEQIVVYFLSDVWENRLNIPIKVITGVEVIRHDASEGGEDFNYAEKS
jgi:hypothetical protein